MGSGNRLSRSAFVSSAIAGSAMLLLRPPTAAAAIDEEVDPVAVPALEAHVASESAHPALGTRLDSIESTGVGAPSTQDGTIEQPASKSIWQFQPVDSRKAPFRLGVDGASFNGTWNTIANFGYNCAGGGLKLVSHEPVLAWALEQDYNDGSTQDMETYIQFQSSDDSVGLRLFMWKIKRNATSYADVLHSSTIMGNPLSVTFPDASTPQGIPTAQFEKGVLRLMPFNDVSTQMQVKAGKGQSGSIALGYNAVDGVMALAPSSASSALISVAGRPASLWLSSSPLGAPGQSISVGSRNNTAVAYFDLAECNQAVKGLVIRSRAAGGQTGELVALLAADGVTNMGGFDRHAYLNIRKISAPPEAALNRYDCKLWFDATAGSAKLTIMARDAEGIVRTGSVRLS